MVNIDHRMAAINDPERLASAAAPHTLSGAAFHEFLQNWKPLDERAPRQDLSSDRQTFFSKPGGETKSGENGLLQAIEAPAHSIVEISASQPGRGNDLKTPGISTVARSNLSDRNGSPILGIARADKSLSALPAAGLESVYRQASTSAGRFSWGRTALSALWSDEGVAVTLRDFTLSDKDAEKILREVETTLASEGLPLRRLVVNGKCIWDSSTRR